MRGLARRSGNRFKGKPGGLFRIGVVCVVLIAALGILGASYASWSQPFSIFGSITTGEINVVVRNVILESSDGYESRSFNANRTGDIVDEVDMNVVTDANPFNSVLVFTVENDGTMPVACEGIDSSVPDSLDIQVIEAPPKIDVGQTADIKVRISKGYCENLEFSTFLKFVQSTGESGAQ